MSPLPQQWPLPQERYLFSHYRSSGRSRRKLSPFFPLPQQCLPPQELSLRFPTALAVPAPAGALPVFPHYRSSDCSPHERYLYFPHCHSSVCSSRSASCFPPLPQQCLLPQERKYISPLPQQCPLPQEPSHYFPTAAAVSAPAGALSIFPHCRSSVRSRRSLPIISPLPQQCPLPQELHQYLPTARSSVCSHRSTIYISPLPQQYLPSHPPSSPHTATPAHFSRSRFFL